MSTVIKKDGQAEPFSEEKLRISLMRAGASHEDVRRVLRTIRKRFDGTMTSRQVHRRALAILRKRRGSVAARYNLKRAILQLGPTGYPFERLMGAVMERRGYETRVGVVLEGRHVSHEVDVVASKPAHRILMECKYRGGANGKADLKIALYVHARALDLLERIPQDGAEFWLVTNGKFTSDALRYGTAVGLGMRSWDHPRSGNVAQMIETSRLHPVTCLTTLKKRHKQRLLERGIVLVRHVAEHREALPEIGLAPSHADRVEEEVRDLLEAASSLSPPAC